MGRRVNLKTKSKITFHKSDNKDWIILRGVNELHLYVGNLENGSFGSAKRIKVNGKNSKYTADVYVQDGDVYIA